MSQSIPPILKTLDAGSLEAVLEVMYLAAYADGEFSEEEKEHFRATVSRLTDGRIVGAGFHELVARFKKALETSDSSARLAALKTKLRAPEHRKAALEEAIKMAAADRIIRTSERELFLEMAEQLDLDRGEAADMVKQYEPR